ncbi:MAG: hypothetical protein ACOYMG_11380 [Candidatus Methylumidiphilus sp.]
MDQHTNASPKKIDLPCIVEIAGCGVLAGRTREMTESEASLQCPSLAFPGARKPKVGATGLLTLTFQLEGASRVTLKIPCRIAFSSANLLGVQINTQALNSHHRENFTDLLRSKK